VAVRRGGVLHYLHGDHKSSPFGKPLSSTSLATDGTSGAKVSRVLYYPYGETRYSEGTLPTDYQYTGQRAEGFGLYDYAHLRCVRDTTTPARPLHQRGHDRARAERAAGLESLCLRAE